MNENNNASVKSDYIFVDFQGFKDNFNRFVVKEFAAITKNIVLHYIVKSPKNIILDEEHRKQAEWLREKIVDLETIGCTISLNKQNSNRPDKFHACTKYHNLQNNKKKILEITVHCKTQ